ncbi:GerAB/ArcD/ProY family transporter [Tumebacillus lipolyticus]|uniref:Endospore germination permease n=1 Tax=Tumebacillus lipolyticus TaxID=1280370 RepID=A0ABW5A105_9BACL
MIKTGHLGRIELLSLIFIASIADAALIYPQQLVHYGSSAGWMIPLISMLISFGIWAWVGPVLVKAGPKADFVSLARRFLGPFCLPILLIISIYLLLDMTALVRGFVEAVISTVLPRSPISFVTIPFMLMVLQFAYTGVEGLSRVAWLMTPLTMISFLALLVLNTNWWTVEYLFPFFGNGIWMLLKGGGMFTCVFTNLFLLMVLLSRLRDRKDAIRIGYWSILLVALVYTVITLVFIMAFSPDGALRSPYPMYQLGRLIYIGRFIQRLEALFVFVWVTLALMKASVLLWAISYLIASAFRMPVNRPLVFPLGVIVYSLMFLPASFVEMLELNNLYIVQWGFLFIIVLPLLTMIFFRIRLKKEARADAEVEKTA